MIAEPRSNPNQMSQTALIVGAVVGTVSILFVCGWLLYCYKKRQSEREPTSSRNTHIRTPNLPGKEYIAHRTRFQYLSHHRSISEPLLLAYQNKDVDDGSYQIYTLLRWIRQYGCFSEHARSRKILCAGPYI